MRGKMIVVKVKRQDVYMLTKLCRTIFEGPAQSVAALAYTIAELSVSRVKPGHRDKAKEECLRILNDAYDEVQSQEETKP